MKILFLPDCARGNPYQETLGEALRKQGFDVGKVHTLRKVRFFPILRSIKSAKPHILHLHWTDPYLACDNWMKAVVLTFRFFLEILIVKCMGIKMVWTIHNLFQHEGRIRGERFVNKILVGLSNQVIVHAAFSKSEVMKAYGLAKRVKKKINIIPHGHFIDVYENSVSQNESRQKLGIDPKNVVFLYFGMIRPYKGISRLLRAFKNMNYSNINLLIVGEPKSDELKK